MPKLHDDLTDHAVELLLQEDMAPDRFLREIASAAFRRQLEANLAESNRLLADIDRALRRQGQMLRILEHRREECRQRCERFAALALLCRESSAEEDTVQR